MIDVLPVIDTISAENERDYMAELFDRYSKKVKLLAFSILGNESDAEDAVGMTFIKLIRYRDRLSSMDEAQLMGWIALVTRCCCLDFKKKRDRFRMLSIDGAYEDDDGAYSNIDIADDIDIAHDIVRNEAVEQLHRAINELSSPAREIIMLKYFNDMSNVMTADLLDMKPSTVGTVLQRSLKKLRTMLEGYYDERK